MSEELCKTIDDPNRSVTANVSCVFPFVYEGVPYNDCAWDDKGAWCSTKTDNQNNHEVGKEGACASSCPIKPHSENQSKWYFDQWYLSRFSSIITLHYKEKYKHNFLLML